jgi:L-asparaginase II
MSTLRTAEAETLVQVLRNGRFEARHRGAIAVVEPCGRLRYHVGDPDLVAYMRSAAKPFQLLPLVESGAVKRFGFSDAELAVMCASHSGEDYHQRAVVGILEKIGLEREALRCGVHRPLHQPTADALIAAGEKPTVLHCNCSGKHAGMLALCVHLGLPPGDYDDPQHPIQQAILTTLAEMTGLARDEIGIGVDGCGVPTFAVPLRHAAWAYARLVDPRDLPAKRARACRRIVTAVRAHPEMVGGTGRLDTDVMRAVPGLVAKGGAAGYQGMGVWGRGGAALGIALKVEDGDAAGRAVGPAAIETLRQLGVVSQEALDRLGEHHVVPLVNNHGERVGEARACFQLKGGESGNQ